MNEQIKLVLSEQHAEVVQKACEAYCRAKLGQFKYMLDELFPHLDYNRGRAIERFIRQEFMDQALCEGKDAEFYFPMSPNASWGVNHEKFGDGALAYEVEKVLENYLAVRKNDGYWGSGTNFSEPLTKDTTSLPQIEGFQKYKDFPLNAAKSKKMHSFVSTEQWDKAWTLINNLRKQGYLNYEGGEQKIMSLGTENPDAPLYFVRVFKPRRKEE